MTVILDILSGLMFAAFGALLMIGAQRRWKWLVDPPDQLWPIYPQSLVKKLCGAEVLEVLAFNCGLIFTVCSVVGTAAMLASCQRRTVESVLWTNAKQNR